LIVELMRRIVISLFFYDRKNELKKITVVEQSVNNQIKKIFFCKIG